jgi:predicted sulfurtransferase
VNNETKPPSIGRFFHARVGVANEEASVVILGQSRGKRRSVALISKDKCNRCGVSFANRAHTMSFFNTDMICMNCVQKERKNSRYKEAHDTECEAVRRGDYNFPGIGKPEDL